MHKVTISFKEIQFTRGRSKLSYVPLISGNRMNNASFCRATPSFSFYQRYIPIRSQIFCAPSQEEEEAKAKHPYLPNYFAQQTVKISVKGKMLLPYQYGFCISHSSPLDNLILKMLNSIPECYQYVIASSSALSKAL